MSRLERFERIARTDGSRPRNRGTPSWLVTGIGVGLFLVAAVHHAVEVLTIDHVVGPVAAFLLDGPPALALAYGGVRLGSSDLAREHRWTVCVWCVAGMGLLTAVVGSSIAIRVVEGRAVTEAPFVLLLAANAGGVAGFVAGYQHARAREAARNAVRATDALAFVNGMLRHDLRNDVQVVETYAALIESGAETDEISDHASTIRTQTAQAVELMESTGAVAETLTGDPALERVDLAPIAAESADRVDEAFDATVSTDLPESAPVAANEGVRSVVDNLVENAAEHNDADDPRVRVRVEADDETVRLRVRDNGSSVPDGSAFEPGDGADCGGLHIVETLVERYGGDVWFEDADGRGAASVVELPRAEAVSRAEAETREDLHEGRHHVEA